MESDSSSFIHTTYSVDMSIDNYIKRNKDNVRKHRENVEHERKNMYEEFVANFKDEFPYNLNGLHFYTFTENKIKFGFNPSEVAHVSKRVKFICILKYTGKYWTPGRNTLPANWKQRIFDLFFQGKSVDDGRIFTTITKIHSLLMEWSKEHDVFRKRKIQKYRNGEIDFFELDSEDEELHLSVEEREEIRGKREVILERMIPPKKKKRRTIKKVDFTTFQSFPNLELDSD